MAADMTAIFAADVTLAQAQAKLAEVGQWLPMDGRPDLPLGRLAEENSTGPLRLGYGAWRDLLLGVQFTNGRGQFISAGGITMKNVAGYDLTKFMVGQHGVFGRIVTLATRTYRRPAGAIHATYPAATSILEKLLPTALRPQWAMLTNAAGPGLGWHGQVRLPMPPNEITTQAAPAPPPTNNHLVLGYIGDDAALDYYERELSSTDPATITRQPLDADIALRDRPWCGGPGNDANVVRVSIAPSHIAAFVSAVQPAHFAADPAFGVIRLFDTPIVRIIPLLPQFAARATSYDGRRLVNYNISSEEQALLQRLKTAFDPDGRLTPLEFAR
ncbi:MAG: FAD-binding oxidoreductase [Tepidisphaerales bacterium]